MAFRSVSRAPLFCHAAQTLLMALTARSRLWSWCGFRWYSPSVARRTVLKTSRPAWLAKSTKARARAAAVADVPLCARSICSSKAL